jgi:hypothetical protein
MSAKLQGVRSLVLFLVSQLCLWLLRHCNTLWLLLVATSLQIINKPWDANFDSISFTLLFFIHIQAAHIFLSRGCYESESDWLERWEVWPSNVRKVCFGPFVTELLIYKRFVSTISILETNFPYSNMRMERKVTFMDLFHTAITN